MDSRLLVKPRATLRSLWCLFPPLLTFFLLTGPPHFDLQKVLSRPLLPDATKRGLLVALAAQPKRRQVFLLGTVHLGNTSAVEAADLIQTTRPKAVVLEVSPSRLASIRKMQQSGQQESRNPLSSQPTPSSTSLARSIALTTALVRAGWAAGGLSGMGVACIIAKEALELDKTRAEQERDLPRVETFSSAVAAADAIGVQVVAADLELPELIRLISQAMGPLAWLRHIVAEVRGEMSRDPIKRGHFNKNETLVEWALRRRDVALARASKHHAESASPIFSRMLVDARDTRFAAAVKQAAALEPGLNNNADNDNGCVVGAFGLVHLDGVRSKIV